jgi:hypothetical protein
MSSDGTELVMKGSEFATTFGPQGLAAWEAAAVNLAQQGQLFIPPFLPVPVTDKTGTLKGTLQVTSDVVSVGDVGDVLRLPLTPAAAQAIANLTGGSLLPTRKIVKDTWAVATKKMTPHPMVPNLGANMSQYVQHSSLIDADLAALGAAPGEMISGIKKDVVLSNIWQPGKVVIYGWIKPDGSAIQPLTNVHGDFYVDYSHGIRLVAPTMQVEGIGTVSTEAALKDPKLSAMLSDEGPLRVTRYPSSVPVPNQLPNQPGPTPGPLANFSRVFMAGLVALVHYAEERNRMPA